MAVKIILPPRFAKSPVLGGIAFDAAEATVPALGSNARRFFEVIGATVTDAPTNAAPTEVLADRTRAELVDLAEEQGVDLPPRAKKADIVEALTQHEED